VLQRPSSHEQFQYTQTVTRY